MGRGQAVRRSQPHFCRGPRARNHGAEGLHTLREVTGALAARSRGGGSWWMWGSFLNENHSGLVTGCEEGGNKDGPRMLLGITRRLPTQGSSRRWEVEGVGVG